MSSHADDVTQALRALASHARFSVVATMMLAAAVALTTVSTAVVYGVLLRPLPYAEPDRLVRVSERHPGSTTGPREPVLSDLTFAAWRAAPRVLEGLAGYTERAYTLTRDGDAERIRAAAVSPELFQLLRLRPAAGNFFNAGHAVAGADAVVVLTHGFWRDRFGGDPIVIGRSIILDGRAHTILGIAPEGFSFPDRGRAMFTPLVPPQADVTTPLERRPTRIITAIGRLVPGATLAHAKHEGTAIARGEARPVSAELLFGKGGPVEVDVAPLTDPMIAGVRPMLWMLATGVGLVLIITCANIGGLSLVRSVARERELAVRMALGAEPRRLRRQLAHESLAISLTAVALGIAAAAALLRALPALAPASLPRLEDVRLDLPVMLAVVAVSLASGVAAMCLPALPSTRTASVSLRHAATHTANVTRRYSSLVIAETALAVVLVVSAALLTRSLIALMTVDAGYSALNIVTARITLQGSRDLAQRWTATADAVIERLRAIDGVDHAGAASMAPFGDTNHLVGFRLPAADGEPAIARTLGYVVTPGYIETLRIPLRQGRLFTASDAGSGTQPVVVNEEYVRQYVRRDPAVGQQYINTLGPNVVSEIVGVVANVLKDGLDRQAQPEIYVLAGHHGALTTGRQMTVAIRGVRDSATLGDIIRDAVRRIDPAAAVHNVTTLDAERSASLAQPRLATVTLVWFAATSLGLVAAGLYGVLSYTVSRRQREFAVRAALGASRATLTGSVLRAAMLQGTLGIVVGMALAAAGARSVHSLLFGIAPLDPGSFLIAAAIVLLVSIAASLVPAHRASQMDLTRSLRAE